jgi:hypothetical protein
LKFGKGNVPVSGREVEKKGLLNFEFSDSIVFVKVCLSNHIWRQGSRLNWGLIGG